MHRLHHSLHPAGTVRQALHMSWKQQTEEWDEDRKIPESVLKRSVFKQIRTKRPEVLVGAGVGEDCAVMKLAEDEVFVLSTDPITGTAKDMGELAVHVTANDLASAGAEPVGMLLTVLLPESVEEADIRNMMEEVENACHQLNIQVMGRTHRGDPGR